MSEDNRYAPPRAPVGDTDEGELASLGARFAGALIDGILVALLVWPYLLSTDYMSRAGTGDIGVSDLLGLSLVSMILFLVLHGYLLHKYGQTIGKRIVGTRIVSVTDNQILPLGKIFGLRYVPIQLVSIIPVLGNFLPLADVLFIFREDRRCLHDLIAGTKVIKAR
jgi:uncharacterized RDD family membrane protein YckC